MIVALLPSLFACAPGHLAWEGGDDDVRTAIVERSTDAQGWMHARVFLSNGAFPCGLPTFDDPMEQQRAIAGLLAAACREDARHVRLDLYWPDVEDGTGRFPGDARAVAGDERTIARFARASYVGIDEAWGLSTSSLIPAYGVSERTWAPSLGNPGEVVVRAADELTLRGTFAFEEAHISGSFEAEVCEEPVGGTSLMGLMDFWGGDPTVLCGVDLGVYDR